MERIDSEWTHGGGFEASLDTEAEVLPITLFSMETMIKKLQEQAASESKKVQKHTRMTKKSFEKMHQHFQDLESTTSKFLKKTQSSMDEAHEKMEKDMVANGAQIATISQQSAQATARVKQYSQKVEELQRQHSEELKAAAEANAALIKALTDKMTDVFNGQKKQIEALNLRLQEQSRQHTNEIQELKDDITKERKQMAKRLEAEKRRVDTELAEKVGVGMSFVLRTERDTAIQARHRFWKGETMTIDRFADKAERPLEDWQ